MKWMIIIALLPILILASASAQLGGLANKVKNKVNQRVDKRTDQEIDKALDKIEGKEEKKQPAPVAIEANPPADTGTKVYSKYDFVPGELVVYANQFESDKTGELPTGWNTNGTAAVVTLSKHQGNWVQLFQNSTYLTDNANAFSENFTVEFDLLLRRDNPKAAFPQFAFGVLSSGESSTTDNALLKEYYNNFATELKLQPYDNNASHMHLETFQDKKRYLNTDIKKYPNLQKLLNQPIHIAMQVQKERLRIWFNEEKMYDLPKAMVAGININQLYFVVKRYGGSEEEVGYYVANIKIARGLPDTRHKLAEEGKFSTTGILFDVNAATIKPESSGVLKEVAEVLNKFSDIKVTIVGHTDSDGSDAANLQLSKKRAEAVAEALSKEYGIDPERMKAEGKGEQQPVGDNKTREGKAQNRRVEFIKQ